LAGFISEALSNLSIFLAFLPVRLLGRVYKIRKLSYFADKEGKVRVIAILDYFSQTVLRPLHLYLFKVLKKIPQDCTFDQGSFRDKVKDWDYFCSVDLSSATDRFPVSLIADVLRGHLPQDYVESWLEVMVGSPFDCDAKFYSYSVGNTMGAYSSWAPFAVSHHYMFFYLCKSLGLE